MGPPASYRVTRVRYYSGVICVVSDFVYGNLTLYVQLFQNCSTIPSESLPMIRNPAPKCGLASFPFARRYLGNRCFFTFLELLRCFSSPRFLLSGYIFTGGYLHIAAGGFPHSDICGSDGYLLLTAAYRSLSRPSSAPSAKASALCSSLLDLFKFVC